MTGTRHPPDTTDAGRRTSRPSSRSGGGRAREPSHRGSGRTYQRGPDLPARGRVRMAESMLRLLTAPALRDSMAARARKGATRSRRGSKTATNDE